MYFLGSLNKVDLILGRAESNDFGMRLEAPAPIAKENKTAGWL